MLRLLEVLLQPTGLVADLHARVLERYHLSPDDYQPSQVRYDLWKLRAKAIVERSGTGRRYRVTATGLRLGTLLVKLRFRLLGPLVTLVTRPHPRGVQLLRTPPKPRCVTSARRSMTSSLHSLSRQLRNVNKIHTTAALGG